MFSPWRGSPGPLLGFQRENAATMGLFSAIRSALPPHLTEQFWSLDTATGIRITLRTGQTLWFMPNTAVSAIVARIVEETSRWNRGQ
jgi:hypothetical protein